MNQIILITGATLTGKTQLATRVARATEATLLPIDQLQMYMHLEKGVGLDYSYFHGIRIFGYHIHDPWMRFSPKTYVSWLRSCILRFRDEAPIVIEGGCTSYLIRLVSEMKSDSVLQSIRILKVRIKIFKLDRHTRPAPDPGKTAFHQNTYQLYSY